MAYFIIFFVLFLIFILIKKRPSIYVIKLKNYVIPIFIVIFLICIICFSNSSLETARNSFMLWVNNVLPSLLPFFICIELLKQTNFIQIIGKALNSIMYPLFNVPGSRCICSCNGNNLWLSGSVQKLQKIYIKITSALKKKLKD